jgi:hypothetical protein
LRVPVSSSQQLGNSKRWFDTSTSTISVGVDIDRRCPKKFFGCIQQAAKSDAKVVSRTFQSAIAECAVRKGEGERDLSQK